MDNSEQERKKLKEEMIETYGKNTSTSLNFIRFIYEVRQKDDIDLLEWIRENNLREKTLDEIITLYKLLRDTNYD